MKRKIVVFSFVLSGAAALFASGGMPLPASSQDRAAQSYNDGIYYRQKAWKLEQELASTSDVAKQGSIRAKLRSKYQDIVRAQTSATKINPTMYQAYGELGYAQRKLGNYAEAMQAYDKALELQPGYVEAIEYRGEAYLALNRLTDAENAYMTLFGGGDHVHSQALGVAMKHWLDDHKTNPADVSPADIQSFGQWLGQRQEITVAVAGNNAAWQ